MKYQMRSYSLVTKEPIERIVLTIVNNSTRRDMILYGPDFNIRFDLRCWKNNYNSHSFFNQNKISFRFICIFNKIYPQKKNLFTKTKPNRFVDVITTFTFISVTWKTIFRSATRGFNWNVFQFWSCEMIHSQLPFPYLFYLTWEANLKKDHLCLSSPLLSSPPSLWTTSAARNSRWGGQKT